MLNISKIETWGHLQSCNGKINLKNFKDPYKDCLDPKEENSKNEFMELRIIKINRKCLFSSKDQFY